MARYPAPTGYAPGGVSYYNSKKKKVYAPPTGYAPGGVEYGPLRRKKRTKIVNPSGTTVIKGAGSGGRKANDVPVGKTASGEVVYHDPDTGEIYTQAEQRVRQQTDPILALIAKREAEERARAQADAGAQSAAVASAYANERAPTQALYDRAVDQSKAVENAVAAKFGKTGETNVAELKAKLEQIGGATGADQAAAAYQGAGQSSYALGMNDVARLIARGAEAQNILGREGAQAQTDIQSSLRDLLLDIGTDYGDQRAELEAGLPGQINDMYERLLADARGQAEGRYGRETAERDRKTEEKRYRSESAAARSAAISEQYNKDREYLLKQRALAMGSNDKRAIAALNAQIKALDRQARIDIAAADREAANARTAAGLQADSASKPRDAAANEKYITDQYGNVIGLNPNYVPPKPAKGKGSSKADVRVRRNQAWTGIQSNVIKPSRGGDKVWDDNKENPDGTKGGWRTEPPERPVGGQTNAQIVSRINAELVAAGIGPNTPLGIQLRKKAFADLGIPTGPNGNPAYGKIKPKKKTTRRGGR